MQSVQDQVKLENYLAQTRIIGARQNLSACETYLYFWLANCCSTLTTGPFIAMVNFFLVISFYWLLSHQPYVHMDKLGYSSFV